MKYSRNWTLIAIFILSGLVVALGQQKDRQNTGSLRGTPNYTYERKQFEAELASAKDDAQRLALLARRWEMIKLAVADVDVLEQVAFYASMADWKSNYLKTGDWTGIAKGDLNEAMQRERENSFLIKGDCLKNVSSTSNAIVHVYGDLNAEINIKGHSEVIIGGDIKPQGSIQGDGIVRVFVGGDVNGSIRNLGSSMIWINGNLRGPIGTGAPSTKLHVMRDANGVIKPAGKPSLLSVDVRGYMPWNALTETGNQQYTKFDATIGLSDKQAGLYALQRSGTCVIHGLASQAK